MKKQSKFPKEWDSERVKKVLQHYETQSEDEAVAEGEAAYEDPNQTFIKVPNELVPAVRELITKRSELRARAKISSQNLRPDFGQIWLRRLSR